ncbi:MAG TPA: entericidin A/B family lipoprotein [Acetobacteraceae bacterium]|jgi:predicted small secreted protein|nr:entericidin A/B family lipoprotein [Acetobacteraceae bacterium]
MRRKLAIIMALLALAGTAPLLTACYTTQGAGQDLQAAGHGLENSAERHTPYQP